HRLVFATPLFPLDCIDKLVCSVKERRGSNQFDAQYLLWEVIQVANHPGTHLQNLSTSDAFLDEWVALSYFFSLP
ncbi:unnamed protein product, partial [Musa textilis]